jgi:hypothetical protein
MDRVVKLMCAAAVSVGVFAACNKDAGGVKVNGPRNLKGTADKPKPQGASTDTDKGKVEDDSNLTAAEKAERERVAKDMKELRPLFRDAGSLYSELKVYLKDPKDGSTDSAPQGYNILKLISWIIENNYNVKGLPYAANDKAECKLGYSGIKADSSTQYSISFAPCNAKDNVEVIAKLIHTADYWEILFNIGRLSGSPQNMMGNLMQIWNAKDGSGAPVESKCRLSPIKDRGRLGTMMCLNIGNDISATKYLLIERLEFSHPFAGMKTLKPVVVDFSIYESTNNEKPKETYKGVGKDDIDLGSFEVDLNATAPEREVARQVKDDLEQKGKAQLAETLKKQEEERKAKEAAAKGDQAQADTTQNGNAQADPNAKQSDPQVGVQQQDPGQQDPNQQQDSRDQ